MKPEQTEASPFDDAEALHPAEVSLLGADAINLRRSLSRTLVE